MAMQMDAPENGWIEVWMKIRNQIDKQVRERAPAPPPTHTRDTAQWLRISNNSRIKDKNNGMHFQDNVQRRAHALPFVFCFQ